MLDYFFFSTLRFDTILKSKVVQCNLQKGISKGGRCSDNIFGCNFT